ncbi:hypothetical protein C8J56DRAFT_1059482 [Mycena floridula]|nr:hypothetical protein C8J56DRAFT_1059482 [Mycena floridula]
MCNKETEGTKHGCGHYIAKRTTAVIDCGSRYCRISASHPPSCNSNSCKQFYGPDRKEVITVTTPNYCDMCEYWYHGQGSRPRQ